MQITANEAKALQAIIDSEYQNGNDRDDVIEYEVWSVYCNPFANKRTQGGTYASLSKKGWIKIDRYDDHPFDTVAITETGYDALQSSKSQQAK